MFTQNIIAALATAIPLVMAECNTVLNGDFSSTSKISGTEVLYTEDWSFISESKSNPGQFSATLWDEEQHGEAGFGYTYVCGDVADGTTATSVCTGVQKVELCNELDSRTRWAFEGEMKVVNDGLCSLEVCWAGSDGTVIACAATDTVTETGDWVAKHVDGPFRIVAGEYYVYFQTNCFDGGVALMDNFNITHFP